MTPKIIIEDIADLYSYYVFLIGVSEQSFWNMELPLLEKVASNKGAIDCWINSPKER